MKTLHSFGFWFPLLLFGLHQLSQKVIGLELLWVDFYLDPFCLTALFFPLLQWERKMLYGQAKLSRLEILLIFVVLVILFEGLLPYFFEQFVADFWDVIAMALGLGWFMFFDDRIAT